MNRLIAWILVTATQLVVARAEPTNDCVILLHGLARTSRSMNRMEKALHEEGYRVLNVSYPTTSKPIEQLSREHLADAVAHCRKLEPEHIHIVAHSLGNIVLRHYLSEQPLPELRRIVMLGPPNKGSEVVDELGDNPIFQWLHGPAGNQLGTEPDSLPNTLPVPDADIGVIAGTRSINWILSTMIPGPDDGKVSPESARIKGMQAFTTIPTSHPFLMRDRKAIALTIRFLRTGRFDTIH